MNSYLMMDLLEKKIDRIIVHSKQKKELLDLLKNDIYLDEAVEILRLITCCGVMKVTYKQIERFINNYCEGYYIIKKIDHNLVILECIDSESNNYGYRYNIFVERYESWFIELLIELMGVRK